MEDTSYKPEYSKPHKWDTKWLGPDISITDIDLIAMGKRGHTGINSIELKHRTPFLNKIQVELFLRYKLLHLVVIEGGSTELKDDKYCFEAEKYTIYCPYEVKRRDIDYKKDRRSYYIESTAPNHHIDKDEARAIFRADSPWPCCGRYTLPDKLTK